ncbi:hypothetical protein, partial [Micrococcus luteus]|uniref:hypothetical protein n=1 Tax=Micrococcus luteus TaxID=1270 RepID=UPI00164286F5
MKKEEEEGLMEELVEGGEVVGGVGDDGEGEGEEGDEEGGEGVEGGVDGEEGGEGGEEDEVEVWVMRDVVEVLDDGVFVFVVEGVGEVMNDEEGVGRGGVGWLDVEEEVEDVKGLVVGVG